MLRALFLFLLAVHGLIHLMGFAKGFKYAEISALQAPISRPMGGLWLLAAALFVWTGGFYLMHRSWWWFAAVPAVALSQILIFQYWSDAKFGTVANIIVAAGIALAWGAWQFDNRVSGELREMTPANYPVEQSVTHTSINALPPIVQAWLERSNSIGKPIVQTVQLRQTGQLRTGPDGKWMPVTAEQYIRTDQPGFLWQVDVAAAPYVHLAGRDLYLDGRGHMLIKALSLIPVADKKGPEIDQGSLLRYLAEVIWYPSAALRPYIRWEAVDSLSARATMRYGGVEASGVFRFTPNGDPESFDALRYYDRKTGATLEKWHIQCAPDGYVEFHDIRIPARSEVSWQLESGDFTWFKLEITDLKYDPATP